MKRMLITAGPTHEAIDAVRYIANRSSGLMGIAIAEEAQAAGWDVVLLLGPVCSQPPQGLHIERFTSTEDLSRLLDQHFASCDVLIMAAAVADYRPVQYESHSKLQRGAGRLTLELEGTPDLVAACADRKRPHQRIIGFALEESAQLEERAANKLRRKKLDAIVANPLETMGAQSIDAKVLLPNGTWNKPPGGSVDKSHFARWLMTWIEGYLFPNR